MSGVRTLWGPRRCRTARKTNTAKSTECFRVFGLFRGFLIRGAYRTTDASRDTRMYCQFVTGAANSRSREALLRSAVTNDGWLTGGCALVAPASSRVFRTRPTDKAGPMISWSTLRTSRRRQNHTG